MGYAIDWYATVATPEIGKSINGVVCQAIWVIGTALAAGAVAPIPVIGPLEQAAWTLLVGVTGLTD